MSQLTHTQGKPALPDSNGVALAPWAGNIVLRHHIISHEPIRNPHVKLHWYVIVVHKLVSTKTILIVILARFGRHFRVVGQVVECAELWTWKEASISCRR